MSRSNASSDERPPVERARLLRAPHPADPASRPRGRAAAMRLEVRADGRGQRVAEQRATSANTTSSRSSARRPADMLAAALHERAQVLQRRRAATRRPARQQALDEPVADAPVQRAQQEDAALAPRAAGHEQQQRARVAVALGERLQRDQRRHRVAAHASANSVVVVAPRAAATASWNVGFANSAAARRCGLGQRAQRLQRALELVQRNPASSS